MSNPTVFYEFRDKATKKPVRSLEPFDPKFVQENSKLWDDGKPSKAKTVWGITVYNYEESSLQVLSMYQVWLQNKMVELVNPDSWGDPTMYDITMIKSVSKDKTSYDLLPEKNEKMTEEIKEQIEKEMPHFDLSWLLSLEDKTEQSKEQEIDFL